MHIIESAPPRRRGGRPRTVSGSGWEQGDGVTWQRKSVAGCDEGLAGLRDGDRAPAGAKRPLAGGPGRGASGVSYSYLSEVERGLKRPSTDVLARLATALNMLPSDLLRYVEEVSAKGRGLFRKRVLEAPMHEHAGGPPEVPAMLDATIASPGDRVGGLQRPSVGRPTAGAPGA